MNRRDGPYEIFFDINGSAEEVDAIASKILDFLRKLEAPGDIAGLDAESLERA